VQRIDEIIRNSFHWSGMPEPEAGAHVIDASDSTRWPEAASFSLGTAYMESDIVMFVSELEGFGNAINEGIYYRKPVIMYPFKIYRSDIRPLGFEFIEAPDAEDVTVISKIHRTLRSSARLRVIHKSKERIRFLEANKQTIEKIVDDSKALPEEKADKIVRFLRTSALFSDVPFPLIFSNLKEQINHRANENILDDITAVIIKGALVSHRIIALEKIEKDDLLIGQIAKQSNVTAKYNRIQALFQLNPALMDPDIIDKLQPALRNNQIKDIARIGDPKQIKKEIVIWWLSTEILSPEEEVYMRYFEENGYGFTKEEVKTTLSKIEQREMVHAVTSKNYEIAKETLSLKVLLKTLVRMLGDMYKSNLDTNDISDPNQYLESPVMNAYFDLFYQPHKQKEDAAKALYILHNVKKQQCDGLGKEILNRFTNILTEREIELVQAALILRNLLRFESTDDEYHLFKIMTNVLEDLYPETEIGEKDLGTLHNLLVHNRFLTILGANQIGREERDRMLNDSYWQKRKRLLRLLSLYTLIDVSVEEQVVGTKDELIATIKDVAELNAPDKYDAERLKDFFTFWGLENARTQLHDLENDQSLHKERYVTLLDRALKLRNRKHLYEQETHNPELFRTGFDRYEAYYFDLLESIVSEQRDYLPEFETLEQLVAWIESYFDYYEKKQYRIFKGRTDTIMKEFKEHLAKDWKDAKAHERHVEDYAHTLMRMRHDHIWALHKSKMEDYFFSGWQEFDRMANQIRNDLLPIMPEYDDKHYYRGMRVLADDLKRIPFEGLTSQITTGAQNRFVNVGECADSAMRQALYPEEGISPEYRENFFSVIIQVDAAYVTLHGGSSYAQDVIPPQAIKRIFMYNLKEKIFEDVTEVIKKVIPESQIGPQKQILKKMDITEYKQTAILQAI